MRTFNIIVTVLFLFTSNAFALTNWIGGNGPFWSSGANWSAGTPTNGDDVRLYAAGSSIRNVNLELNTLYLDGSHILSDLSGTLTVNTYAIGAFAGGSATVRHGSDLTVQQMYVGAGTLATGSMDFHAGSMRVGEFLSIGNNEGARGRLFVGGGSVVASELNVGYWGSGTLHMVGGSVTVANPVTIGHFAGSTGLIEIEAGSLTAPEIYAGFFGGSSTVVQTGGDVRALNWLDIGELIPSVGEYYLSGGTLAAGELVVGLHGTGTLVQSGGVASAGHLYIGPQGYAQLTGGSLSIGTLEIDGTLDITGHYVNTFKDLRVVIRAECFEADLIGSVGYDATQAISTLPGDATLDRLVNISDFSAIAANFNTNGFWEHGDFDYNGVINVADFSLLAGNYGGSARTIPEPSGLLLAVFVLTRKPRYRGS